VLSAQVLALALIPLLSGAVPRDGVMVSPMSLLGIEEHVSADFMVGTWKCSDEFFKWGVTDKEKSTVKSFPGQALMSLSNNGEIKMTNLFKPTEGRWELSSDGIIIYDPKFPERPPQLLPLRKRDNDRIWILLPFTGGSAGIGMVRVSEESMRSQKGVAEARPGKHLKSSEQQREPAPEHRRAGENRSAEKLQLNEKDFLTITPGKLQDTF